MYRTSSALFTVLLAALSCAQAEAAPKMSDEAATEQLLDSIKDDPLKLRIVLQEMPKGSELHNHLDGGPFAEEYLKWAGERDLCLDRQTLFIIDGPCHPPRSEPVRDLSLNEPELWSDAIDVLSLRGILQGVSRNDRSKHDAFFSTFAKFGAVSSKAVGESIASSARVAAADKASYIELIHSPGTLFAGMNRIQDVTWGSSDLDAAVKAAQSTLSEIVSEARRQVDQQEAAARQVLGCDEDATAQGCRVTIRYLTFSGRNGRPADAFRSLLISFAMASADDRFVGINIVGPEDEFNAVKNYDEHMRMIRYLSSLYPDVKKSLHAGELAMGLAPAYALKDHIRKAVEIAGAQRIGHGTDIAFEDDAADLLKELADRHIPVEINLTSNAQILGVEGKRHPLNLYLGHGVPVTLSTDDQGILRTDLTNEYVTAAYVHHLDYGALKLAARNGLEYAFLPGASLWSAGKVGVSLAAPCDITSDTPSSACKDYLAGSQKARLQLDLEHQFSAFETWAASQSF